MLTPIDLRQPHRHRTRWDLQNTLSKLVFVVVLEWYLYKLQTPMTCLNQQIMAYDVAGPTAYVIAFYLLWSFAP
eukprot:2564506-Amphidinium_carterae.1